jgi:hypothetical protein
VRVTAGAYDVPAQYLDLTDLAPAAPAADTVRLSGRQVAGRMFVAATGPTGISMALQPLLARNKIGYWNPPGNATTAPGVLGIAAPTASGTATARSVAVTNKATRLRRLGYPSAATAGSIGGARVAAAQFSCGSGVDDGSGFMSVFRWVESDPAPVAGRREFIGMATATTAPTNVEPSALTNAIGVGQISTDATQYYWIQGGSAAQAAVACGVGFQPGGNSVRAFELAILAPQGVANTYYLQLTNLITGATVTRTMSGAAAAVPQSSSLLAFRAWCTNNATALAVGIDWCSLYLETDD